MITKERFIKTLRELKQLETDIENVHKALKQLDPDFGGFYLSRVSTLIIDLLQASMDDKYEWISYFIYELNWGKTYHKKSISDKDGNNIKLKNVGDLYNYLINKPIFDK